MTDSETSRFVPSDRRANFKNAGLFRGDELRRRREEQQVEIRKQKREENLSKRRNLAVVSTSDDEEEEQDASHLEYQVGMVLI